MLLQNLLKLDRIYRDELVHTFGKEQLINVKEDKCRALWPRVNSG